MYNIIEQHENRTPGASSIMLNDTAKPVITTTSAGYKIDCAKECPCGVPVIPVPDQWLEVMVTGGFKVWHIIFIIIAFVVTIVVVYCCFHRCRIPRTKQEIEADLMRSNLTNKFRDYLQEFPNEPTTFLEALKRVQDLEEKSEQDDPGARKRKGWLKRMGKERQAGEKAGGEAAKEGADASVPTADGIAAAAVAGVTAPNSAPDGPLGESIKSGAPQDPSLADGQAAKERADNDRATGQQQQQQPDDGALASTRSKHEAKRALKSKRMAGKVEKLRQDSKSSGGPKGPEEKNQDAATTKSERRSAQTKAPAEHAQEAPTGATQDKSHVGASDGSNSASAGARPTRARKKRDKPNLSRTKATHVGSRGESAENHNVLAIPAATHHKHHHHGHQHAQHHHQDQRNQQQDQQHSHKQQQPDGRQKPSGQAHAGDEKAASAAPPTTAHRRAARSKAREPKESTVIQIDSSPGPPAPPQPPTYGKSRREKK